MEITVAKLVFKASEDEVGFSGAKLGKEVAVFMGALHTMKANGRIQHLYSTDIVVWMEAATELYLKLVDYIVGFKSFGMATRIGRALPDPSKGRK